MDERMQHTVMNVDGNALAGPLSDVFAVDVTTVVATCRECGLAAPLAEADVELDSACAIVRCRGCTRTLFTALRTEQGDLRIVLASMAELRIA